ncbi:MAG TPA: hypothetical protein VJ765_11325 [Chitinophagaceae bacterium]|nr:hypothetical protein [Chitinophagaceae bacterium]
MGKIILSLLICLPVFAIAQDSLPAFSVVNKGNNRVVISWNNKFKQLKQISIQRSADSLSNFKSLITVPDPNNKQNGYLDAKAPHDKMFYRLYILVDGSNFIFSKSKRPANDSIRTALLSDTASKRITDSAYLKLVDKIISQNLADSSLTTEELVILRRYRSNKHDLIPDSLVKRVEAVIKGKNKPDVVIPMYHVIANKDGLVRISLVDFNNKKYSIRFYEDDNTFLFELKHIKDSSLMLEKSNFYRSGWYKSELYESEKLIEKNRFFIPKDF